MQIYYIIMPSIVNLFLSPTDKKPLPFIGKGFIRYCLRKVMAPVSASMASTMAKDSRG